MSDWYGDGPKTLEQELRRRCPRVDDETIRKAVEEQERMARWTLGAALLAVAGLLTALGASVAQNGGF